MIQESILLYNWDNGVFMIGIFIFVCIALVGALLAMMFGGKPKKDPASK